MATTTNTDPANLTSEESYTAMETADVQAIGAHCQMPFCGQLDFLPFRCESCKSTYCLDHRSETAHKCVKAGEWARRRALAQQQTTSHIPLSSKPTVLTAQQCSDPTCKTFINTTQSQAVHCTTCRRDYCLKHRFPEAHECKTLIPKNPQESNADKIRNGFSKLRAWREKKQDSLMSSVSIPIPAPTKTRNNKAAVAALNTLKRNAKGDAKVPVDKRIYLHVEAAPEQSTQTQTQHKAIVKPLFFGPDWPVGRLLDEAAKALGVQNMNNSAQGEAQRLRIYHVESGRVLPFSEKVGQACQSGNTVVLLRGVGDPEAEVDAVRNSRE